MQNCHDENISQKARILFRMLRWRVVDSVLFSDFRHEADIQRPAIDFNALAIAANNCSNTNLLSAISILRIMIEKDVVGSTSFGGIISVIRRWWGMDAAKDYVVDTFTVVSSLSALMLYTPAASRPGGEQSEYNVKTQLWAPILSIAFTMLND